MRLGSGRPKGRAPRSSVRRAGGFSRGRGIVTNKPSVTTPCPHCAGPVKRSGFDRKGAQRLRCKRCGITWIPEPKLDRRRLRHWRSGPDFDVWPFRDDAAFLDQLTAAVNRVLPVRLREEIRREAAQDLLVAILSGALALADLTPAVIKAFLGAASSRIFNPQTISLDAPITGGAHGLPMSGRIADLRETWCDERGEITFRDRDGEVVTSGGGGDFIARGEDRDRVGRPRYSFSPRRGPARLRGPVRQRGRAVRRQAARNRSETVMVGARPVGRVWICP